MAAIPSATKTERRGEEADSRFAPLAPTVFDFDVYLLLIVAALLAMGLLMVYSTTFDWSYLEFGSPVRIFLNQVRSAIVGGVIAFVAWRIDYRILRDRRVATAIMLVTIFALGVLLFVNSRSAEENPFGANRALYQGSFQPGEAAKLAVIIYFAAWLASRREQLHKLGYGLIPFTVLIGTVGSLIVLQPDLSTAAIIVLTAVTMFFIGGANILQIGVISAGAIALGWTIATQLDYARDRLIKHIDAMRDLKQASWHVQQAVIAFRASGSLDNTFGPNLFGVGLGQSSQKFGYLPAAHTDSIFAIVGEELGLFGCLVVVLLFILFVWRAFKIAGESREPFGQMLAVGIGVWIAFEAMVNIAVMTTIIPFTGVALPFISYGGSSLVVVLTGVGLLMSISRKRPLQQERRLMQIPQDYAMPRDGRARRSVYRVGRQRNEDQLK
jgi:cell division protein FtsW